MLFIVSYIYIFLLIFLQFYTSIVGRSVKSQSYILHIWQRSFHDPEKTKLIENPNRYKLFKVYIFILQLILLIYILAVINLK